MPLVQCSKNNQDGWKWGNGGICFIGPGAKERAEAVGRAIKSADQSIFMGDSSAIKATLDDVTGFLKAPVTLARVGVQHYYGYELGLKDRALDRIGVFRPPEEVFHEDALASFENMVVTDDHPSIPVTVDNVKELQAGQVSGIAKTDRAIIGFTTITDKDLIKKIQSGKDQVSVGYGHELKQKDGVFNNEAYEYIQTGIRGNHLAVVQAGRCGPSCKITTDDKGGTPMIITIDGIDYETDNKQLAQAVGNLQASHDAEENEFKKKLKEKDEEMEEVKKEKDEAEAKAEVASKDSLTDDQLSTLVGARAKLLTDATLVLGQDKMPECGCPNKVMAAVVDHVFPDISLDGKSVDYVTATYDLAIAKASKSKKSMDNLKEDFTKDEQLEITRDSARDGYMKDMGFNVEGQ